MIDEYIKFTDFYGGRAATNRRTDSDWHLIPLTKLIIAPPALKTSYINYEDASGAYDVTSINGLNYSNRIGKWQFKLRPDYDFDEIRFALIDWLHGGYFKIEMSSETDGCYYLGRVMVDEWKSTDRGDYITLSYIIEPFAIDPSTSISQTIIARPDSPITVNIPVTRMPVNPYIYIKSLSGTLSIVYEAINFEGGSVYNAQKDIISVDTSENDRQVTDILFFKAVGGVGLKNDTTPITFSVNENGFANVTLKYTGGRL